MKRVDLKLCGGFSRADAEQFLDWYPDPEDAPDDILDVLCLGSSIAREDIIEVLLRVKANAERRWQRSQGA